VLSLAVGIHYVLCTVFWLIRIETAMDFLNALFHGLDFRTLQTGAAFSLPAYLHALVAFMAAICVAHVESDAFHVWSLWQTRNEGAGDAKADGSDA
jgi:hypothetical protein